MTALPGMIRRQGVRLVALAVILVLYGLAQLPEATENERAALATRFAFVRSMLPEVTGPPLRTVRSVHPSLKYISAWISSVGAAVGAQRSRWRRVAQRRLLRRSAHRPGHCRAGAGHRRALPAVHAQPGASAVRLGDYGTDGLSARRPKRGRSHGPRRLLLGTYPCHLPAGRGSNRTRCLASARGGSRRRTLVFECRHTGRPGWRRARRFDRRQLFPGQSTYPRRRGADRPARVDAALDVQG